MIFGFYGRVVFGGGKKVTVVVPPDPPEAEKPLEFLPDGPEYALDLRPAMREDELILLVARAFLETVE